MGARGAEGEVVDAVILAGGRISGWFAREAGTTLKALVPVAEWPLVDWVAAALRRTAGVGRICVVGPEALRAALPAGTIWQAEGRSAPENILAGLEGLRAESGRRVLLCGCDLPMLAPAGLEEFLRRAPAEAAFCFPVVRKERFQARFPGNLGIYVRLQEGAFTGGGVILAETGAVRRHLDLLRALFQRRKSQLAMAWTLGPAWMLRLMGGRLTVADLEVRASELVGAACRAVPDCRPELAFDVDSVFDLRYARKWRAAWDPAEEVRHE